MKRVAVVGSGIAGLGVAYTLARDGALRAVAGAQPQVSFATRVELPRPEPGAAAPKPPISGAPAAP